MVPQPRSPLPSAVLDEPTACFVTYVLPVHGDTGHPRGYVRNMRSPLDISIELEDGRAVLSLAGELDATTLDLLVRCLGSLDPQFGTVVLDLAALVAIDSDAMHTLVALRDEMAVRMQRLECRNTIGSPAQMFEMAGVARSLGLA